MVGHFIIEREANNGSFAEKTRYAKINSVSVHPHPNWRHKGPGSGMVRKFEEKAKRFGASKIIGEISASDYNEEPWLLNFYEKLGFILIQKGEGFTFKKDL